MVKILIAEDSGSDLIERYGTLAGKHEVELVYDKKFYHDWESGISLFRDRVSAVFGNIPIHRNAREVGNFDLYFLDGLEGRCFWYFGGMNGNLPKEKTFIATADSLLRREADQGGYNTIDPYPASIEKVVNQFS